MGGILVVLTFMEILRFFFEPGFGLSGICGANWTNSHPKRTLGVDWWGQNKSFKTMRFWTPHRDTGKPKRVAAEHTKKQKKLETTRKNRKKQKELEKLEKL